MSQAQPALGEHVSIPVEYLRFLEEWRNQLEDYVENLERLLTRLNFKLPDEFKPQFYPAWVKYRQPREPKSPRISGDASSKDESFGSNPLGKSSESPGSPTSSLKRYAFPEAETGMEPESGSDSSTEGTGTGCLTSEDSQTTEPTVHGAGRSSCKPCGPIGRSLGGRKPS